MTQIEKQELESKINKSIQDTIKKALEKHAVYNLSDNQVSEFGQGVKSDVKHWLNNIIPEIKENIGFVIQLHK